MFALELIFTGLCVGAVYSLIAHGLNITFWTTKVLNFGQGQFMMFSSMLVMTFLMTGLPWVVSILLGFVIIMILGYFLERFSTPSIKISI